MDAKGGLSSVRISLPISEFSSSGEAPDERPSQWKGELYLLIGTDSGFEGLTRLFYRDYLRRSRREIDRMRGGPFPRKTAAND